MVGIFRAIHIIAKTNPIRTGIQMMKNKKGDMEISELGKTIIGLLLLLTLLIGVYVLGKKLLE